MEAVSFMEVVERTKWQPANKLINSVLIGAKPLQTATGPANQPNQPRPQRAADRALDESTKSPAMREPIRMDLQAHMTKQPRLECSGSNP
jgi:hypothetical protein